jgi:hypothetical protein
LTRLDHIGEQESSEYFSEGADFEDGIAIRWSRVICASMARRNYPSPLRLDYAGNNADIISLNSNPFVKDLADLSVSGKNE